ncbi:MAG: hypothetical protein J4F29_20195 [Candidatus Latescibacteria bacterium]|nr:hypothetical protein [Candidatus Latescibacterota bacterium]
MSSVQDDRAVLIALYDATNGEGWKDNKNWKTDKPLSEWCGVKTNASELVTELRLHNNQLSGEIPAELGQLARLKHLWLHENQLSGQIPEALGKLTNLEELGLHNNALLGGIPEILGELTNLETLILWENQLSGQIPEALGKLGKLKGLGLSNNQLSGPIPVALKQLTNLERLVLKDNVSLYASEDTEFRAWLMEFPGVTVDDLDQAQPLSPSLHVVQGESNSAVFREIKCLLDGVKSPGDQSQTLELLDFYLHLTQTLNNRVRAIDDGGTNSQILANSIQTTNKDLAEIQERIAKVSEQTKDIAQKQSELEDKREELKNKKSALKTRSRGLKKAEDLIAELKTEIPRIEVAIQQIEKKNPDFALRVSNTDQEFHETIEQFLKNERSRLGIMRQIEEMLRLHHDDNDQILKALKEGSEQLNLNTAIDLIDEIAKNLGNLDRCLGALTAQLDSTS